MAPSYNPGVYFPNMKQRQALGQERFQVSRMLIHCLLGRYACRSEVSTCIDYLHSLLSYTLILI